MTSDNAIDVLHRLLGERGVEWWDDSESVYWDGIDGTSWTAERRRAGDLYLCSIGITPEQAIAATLGGGECIPRGEWKRISQTQEVRHVFCECGYELGMDERDSFPFECTRLFAMPNYCQECGRKIRKAVKR